jgi:hypothetical protein
MTVVIGPFFSIVIGMTAASIGFEILRRIHGGRELKLFDLNHDRCHPNVSPLRMRFASREVCVLTG